MAQVTELHRPGLTQSFPAASAILPYTPVRLGGTSGILALPLASTNQRPFGMNGAGTAGASGLNSGEMVTVYEESNVVKAIAGASLGAGAEVAIGSTNGILVPIAVASGVTAWAVGESLSAAAGGEIFSLYIKPRQLGGLA